jgi:multidrug resistance protein
MSKKAIILFTVFIDVLGIGIVVPVLPFYVQSFGVSDLGVTMLFSVFALFSFLSAPMLGSLSDRIGRRPVLLVSIASTAIGWLVFASAKSVIFLFLGRIIDGMAAGNISTAQGYLSDLAGNDAERTANLGLLSACFGIGFILGPFIGGLLGSVNHALPFWVVAVLATANVILAYFRLPETHHPRPHLQNSSARDMSQFRHNQEATTKPYRSVMRGVTQSVSKLAISPEGCGDFLPPQRYDRGKVAKATISSSRLVAEENLSQREAAGVLEIGSIEKHALEFNPLKPIFRALSDRNLLPGYGAWFFFSMAVASQYSVFALYLLKIFGYKEFTAGLFMAAVGGIVALDQGVFMKRFWIKNFKEPNLEFYMFLVFGAGYLIMSFPYIGAFVVGLIGISFGQSVLRVVMTSQMVGASGPRRGETLGVMNSVMSLGMIIGPAVAGVAFGWKTRAPFLIAGVYAFTAFIILYFKRKRLAQMQMAEDAPVQFPM